MYKLYLTIYELVVVIMVDVMPRAGPSARLESQFTDVDCGSDDVEPTAVSQAQRRHSWVHVRTEKASTAQWTISGYNVWHR